MLRTKSTGRLSKFMSENVSGLDSKRTTSVNLSNIQMEMSWWSRSCVTEVFLWILPSWERLWCLVRHEDTERRCEDWYESQPSGCQKGHQTPSLWTDRVGRFRVGQPTVPTLSEKLVTRVCKTTCHSLIVVRVPAMYWLLPAGLHKMWKPKHQMVEATHTFSGGGYVYNCGLVTVVTAGNCRCYQSVISTLIKTFLLFTRQQE